jgi:molybdopterin-containing oxidoreductase family iron-sulfur binding subunit
MSTRGDAPTTLAEVRARLDGTSGPAYWRTLEELAGSAPVLSLLEREFPSQRARFGDPVGRRDFLRLMGASLSAFGLGACTRQPEEEILPYARSPEAIVPGKPLFFATAMSLGGAAVGLLVESHMGRPTKIEGNPEHPASLGATDAIAQAAILSLCDPDRSRAVLENGGIATFGAFLDALRTRLDAAGPGGRGIAVLTEPVDSPVLAGMLATLGAELPEASWHVWTPLARDGARLGAELAFGRDVEPRLRLDRARVVVALDADLLGYGPARVRYARDFAAGRRARAGVAGMNRLYAVESSPSLTGGMADHRLALAPDGVERVARALARTLGLAVDAPELPPAEARFVAALARDLEAAPGASAIAAGPWASPAVHAIAHALNARLRNHGAAVELAAPVAHAPAPCGESIAALCADARAGRVETLLVLGGNPVLTAPADLGFAAALERVPFRAHLADTEDETSRLCHWHVPEAHFLEAWGDARAFDGTASIVQPLIAPLYGGRSPLEVLSPLVGLGGRTPYELVRAHWRAARWADADDAAFERGWRAALHDGVVAGTASPAIAVDVRPLALGPPPARAAGAGVDVLFRADASVLDGRFANNGWLQETPRPQSLLVWDNAALVAPATAARLGLERGDRVRLAAGGRAIEAPVWVLPGHAPDAVTLHLGYGRTHGGRVAAGVGFDAYPLRDRAEPWTLRGVSVERVGGGYAFASVQDHGSMEGRDLIREGTFERFRREPELGYPEHHDDVSLYPAWPGAPDHHAEGYAWGMVIDLNACTGCNACTVACQAENSIPVVGKDEVAKGREMHWIRVDRYYAGSPEAPLVRHQPVPCMHCERAPCEVVCPVGATVHGAEGLNEMVYNRCVGTRYCANNCPYKVRRFNFFRYADWETEALKLGRNPDVTVRSRGVMEKCTYCVQRINEARIEAKKAGRAIGDGEVRTACQQVCPSQAIVFGDVHDPKSAVSAARGEPHAYALLAELGTKPRTTYLAKLSNPNPELLGG